MAKLSRRSFAIGLLASPNLVRPASARPTDVDVAIVGAGAAGLAAGRALAKAGVRCVLLEARARVGGRALTDTQQLARPFDMGAHWLHAAHKNPFIRLAKAQGATLSPSFTSEARLFRGGAARPEDRAELWSALKALERRAARLSLLRQDQSLAAIAGGSAEARLAAMVAALSLAADPEDVSVLDYASLEGGRDMTVAGGLGALVARQAEGLDVRLSSAVETLRWDSPVVRLEGGFGVLTARAAIVAIPATLLASERLRFTPPAPVRKQAAFAALPMGAMEKIGLVLRRPLDLPEYAIALPLAERGEAHVLHMSPDRRLATVLVTGDFARGLAREGPAAARDFARRVLVETQGGPVELDRSVVTDWLGDPLSRGAYTHTAVGHSSARIDYAEPIANKIFFAGEACAGGQAVTLGGAHLSGVKAAALALKAL